MAYTISFTLSFNEDALSDLEVTLDYIGADNATAAQRFGNALLNHVELLQNHPRIGIQ